MYLNVRGDVHGGYQPDSCPVCGSDEVVGILTQAITDRSSVIERIYPICPCCHWNSLGVEIVGLEDESATALSDAIQRDLLSLASGAKDKLPTPD